MRFSRLATLISACFLCGTGLLAVEQSAGGRPEAAAKASVAPNVPAEMLPRVRAAQKQYEAGNFAAAERIYGEMLKDAPENVFLLSSYGGLLMQTGKHDLAVETLRKIVTLTPKDPKVAARDRGYADANFNLAVIYVTQSPPDMERARHYYIRAVELGEERDASLEALMKSPARVGPTPVVIPGLPSTPGPQPATVATEPAPVKPAVGPVATPQSPVTAAVGPAPVKPTPSGSGAAPRSPVAAMGQSRVGRPAPLSPSAPVAESVPVKPVAVEGGPTQQPPMTAATAPAPVKPVAAEPVAVPQSPATASTEPAPIKPAPAEIVSTKPAATPAPAAPEGVPDLPPELQATAREGKEQFAHGNYAEAERSYRQILQKQPNNLYILTNLGVVLLRANKYKLSEEFFRKALTISPDSGLTH
jgi:tetratricopeptide (TPR) repeat protein